MTSDAIARPAPAAAAPAKTAEPRWAGPWLVAAALLPVYLVLSVGRFRRMDWASWDLGIFEQAIRAYAHLREPVADLKGPGFNILGDHFSPVIALVAPVYRVFPGPLTLLVVQALLFALSAVPVTRAAGRLLGKARGVAVGVAYGLSWGVQRAVEFDFHEIAFAVPLLAFAWRPSSPAAGGRHCCGGCPWSSSRRTSASPWPPWRGGRLAGPRHRPAHHLDRARPGGRGLRLRRPGVHRVHTGLRHGRLRLLAQDRRRWPVRRPRHQAHHPGLVLVPTSGLLALRSPLLLVAAPTLGWRFLSGDDHYWSTDWHYSAVLMPVVALALVDAIDALRRDRRPWLRSYALQMPAAVLAASLALAATAMPTSRLTQADTYRKPERVVAVERLLARIPDGATVEADTTPLTRLTSRCRVLWIGGSKGVVPDWITIDNGNKWAGEDPTVYAPSSTPASGTPSSARRAASS